MGFWELICLYIAYKKGIGKGILCWIAPYAIAIVFVIIMGSIKGWN